MAPVIWGRSLWQAAEGETVYPLTFREGGSYAASMVIQGQPGWVLTDRTQVRIDGQAPASVTKLGEGRWLVTSRPYTAGLQRTVPAVEVYANVPIFDIPLSEPYIPGYEPYAVYDWYWSDAAGQPLPQDAAVVGGAEYSLTVLVKPEEGYMFSRDTQAARLFWEPCEIVSLEPHLLTLRGLCTARMGTPNPFVDVEKGKFYYEPVIWAYYQGPQITAGTDETHFSPNKVCTRAQVVTFLWRAAGCPAPTLRDHPFTDVKEGAYYYEAMLWAVENGITNGATSTTFAPNKACTRGQVVTFLWRAAGSPEPAGTEHPFTDVKEGAYYYKAMLWAIQEGVTNGATDTAFAPNKDCTRAQVVTFLYRAYGPKG